MSEIIHQKHHDIYLLQDDKSSKTPLMLVIDTMDLDLIKFFLCAETPSQHADVVSKLQAVTRGGDTPLHIAAGVRMESSVEKQKLLRIMIQRGADADAKNNINEVPRDIATNEVVNTLLAILVSEIFRLVCPSVCNCIVSSYLLRVMNFFSSCNIKFKFDESLGLKEDPFDYQKCQRSSSGTR